MKNLKLKNTENLTELEASFLKFQSSYIIPFNLKIPKRFVTAVELNPHHTNILFNKILREALTDINDIDKITQTLKEVAGLDIIIEDEFLELDSYLASKLVQFYLIDAICNDYPVIKMSKELLLTFKKYEKQIKVIYENDDSTVQSLEEYSSNKLDCDDIWILSNISSDNIFMNIPLSIATDYLCSTAFIYALHIDLLEKESLI